MLFIGIMLFIFFSARERAEFNKPCYLIGSWEGRGLLEPILFFVNELSDNRQSFTLFTLLETINKPKFISIYR